MTVKKTFTLAYQNHKKSNFKNAENLYKEVLKTDPNHFEANFLLGTLSMQIKKFDNAKQLLQKAIKIQPNNPDAHYNLGCVFKELGQLDKAIVYFDKVLNIKTDYIEAYFNRGITKNLQKGKIPFDQQKVLDQCLAEILKNHFKIQFFRRRGETPTNFKINFFVGRSAGQFQSWVCAKVERLWHPVHACVCLSVPVRACA